MGLCTRGTGYKVNDAVPGGANWTADGRTSEVRQGVTQSHHLRGNSAPAGATESVTLTVSIIDGKVCRSIKSEKPSKKFRSAKSGKPGHAADCVSEITNSGSIQSAELPASISSDAAVTQVVKAQRMKSAKSAKSTKSGKSQKSQKSQKSAKSGKSQKSGKSKKG